MSRLQVDNFVIDEQKLIILSTQSKTDSGQLICTHIHMANDYNNVSFKKTFI